VTNTTLQHLSANWNYPTNIRFGIGRISELADACKQLGMTRPLLVTDPGLAALPFIAKAKQDCDSAGLGCEIFADVQGNPVGANVDAGLKVMREGDHDGVIAFGGGSALDAGKAIALMWKQTRPLFDFEDQADWWTRVDVNGMAPVVAVPTTSGTGSEVGRASVITDESTHTKKIIFHAKMLPAIVISDPQLTTGLPAHLTAAVGMDALSHNLEAYCSPLYHPMAAGIALEGMRLIRDWLPKVYADGNDLEARAHMQVASTMGATAFQKGLGAMHSLSHPCGAVLNTHHGLTNAVVMPYVLAFNKPTIEAKMETLARFLDFKNPGFTAIQSWVLGLRESLGIPNTLADLKVTEAHASQLAPMAAVDPTAGTNPVPLNTDNCQQLYLDSIRGHLQ